jgi:hypothetical protein
MPSDGIVPAEVLVVGEAVGDLPVDALAEGVGVGFVVGV